MLYHLGAFGEPVVPANEDNSLSPELKHICALLDEFNEEFQSARAVSSSLFFALLFQIAHASCH